jgi:hypothetical protein
MPRSITVSSRAPTTKTASCNSETQRETAVDYCQLLEKLNSSSFAVSYSLQVQPSQYWHSHIYATSKNDRINFKKENHFYLCSQGTVY